MGATIVEKHLTLDRLLPGPDHEASLEPDELDRAIDIVRNAERAKGSPEKRPVEGEMDTAFIARKSLHARRDIAVGTVLSEADVEITRPADGLEPDAYQRVVGRVVDKRLESGDPITETDLKE